MSELPETEITDRANGPEALIARSRLLAGKRNNGGRAPGPRTGSLVALGLVVVLAVAILVSRAKPAANSSSPRTGARTAQSKRSLAAAATRASAALARQGGALASYSPDPQPVAVAASNGSGYEVYRTVFTRSLFAKPEPPAPKLPLPAANTPTHPLPPPPPPGPSVAGLTYSGYYAVDEVLTAVVTGESNREVYFLKEGESLRGASVRRISPDSLTLVRNGVSANVPRTREFSPLPLAAAAPAAAGQPARPTPTPRTRQSQPSREQRDFWRSRMEEFRNMSPEQREARLRELRESFRSMAETWRQSNPNQPFPVPSFGAPPMATMPGRRDGG